MREPTNVVDMGLVEDIDIDGGRVRVEVVLTDPSCLHFGAMQRFITDALTALAGVDEVEVRASTSVLWTPDRRSRPTAVHRASAVRPRETT
jgi:metal-sulfur cluster biosynthetic enzyme